MKTRNFLSISILSLFVLKSLASSKNILSILKAKKLSTNDYESSVMDLINRVIGKYHNVNDFIVVIDKNLNSDDLDAFEVKLTL